MRKENDFIKKMEELDQMLMEQRDMDKMGRAYYCTQIEDLKKYYELSCKKLAEEYDAQILVQITLRKQESYDSFEHIETLQNMNQQLDAIILDYPDKILALEGDLAAATDRVEQLGAEMTEATEWARVLEKEAEKHSEAWCN